MYALRAAVPAVARCHLELTGFISADRLFKFETQHLGVLKNKSYAVLRGGCWLASHTPFETHTAQDRRYTDGSFQMADVVSTGLRCLNDTC